MIRPATEDDLSALTQIYNQAIDQGFITAHINHVTRDERMEWLENHPAEEFPIYVFEQNGNILGWASISAYRQGRKALDEVAEISFYVDFNHHGKNIGSKLTAFCLKKAPVLNKRILFAIVIEGNEESISLLKKFGFEEWGYLPEVIKFQGEIRSHIYMGKILN